MTRRVRRGKLVELPSGLTLQPVMAVGIVGVEWRTCSHHSELARRRLNRFARKFSGPPATMREAAERIRAFAEKEASR